MEKVGGKRFRRNLGGSALIMDARSASVHVIFCRCFFIGFLFCFMAALVGQTAKRIFTKLSHVVDIRHHL